MAVNTTPPPCKVAHTILPKKIQTTKIVGGIRMSKLQKIGNVVSKRLIKSNSLWGKYHYANRANAEIEAAISDTSEGDLNIYAMSQYRETAQKMEELLFSVGGAETITTTLFRDRPTERELGTAMIMLDGDNTKN